MVKNNLKYKIGDRVFVKNAKHSNYVRYDHNYFEGRVGVILDIDFKCNTGLYYYVKFRKNREYFYEDELLLYTRESKLALKTLYGRN